MPDYCELGLRALSGLSHANIRAKVSILDMTVHGNQEDSTTAMRLMKELGVGCTVTLGGDGTNRAVAKGGRSIPLVTISTGTNNVFPAMVEATTVGIAAGVVVSGKVDLKDVVATHKRLIITENGSEKDMALIDAVVMEQPFIGARAIWKLSEVKQVICTRAEPNSVGLSSIGGSVCPVGVEDDYGLYLKLGEGNIKARAAVLPGVIQEVGIEEFKLINLGEEVELLTRPCLVALDGERELRVGATDEVKVRIERDGPHVVDINKATREAAAQGFFTSRN
jgi:predicted polyphosphate/ATP-dependent NAD kinase